MILVAYKNVFQTEFYSKRHFKKRHAELNCLTSEDCQIFSFVISSIFMILMKIHPSFIR